MHVCIWGVFGYASLRTHGPGRINPCHFVPGCGNRHHYHSSSAQLAEGAGVDLLSIPFWSSRSRTCSPVQRWLDVTVYGPATRGAGGAGTIDLSAGGTGACGRGVARVCAACFERAILDPRSLPNSPFCLKKQAPKIRGLANGAFYLRRQGVP